MSISRTITAGNGTYGKRRDKGIGTKSDSTMTFFRPILSAHGPPKNVPTAPTARNKEDDELAFLNR